MTEFDLLAKLNKTIRRNLQEGTYEIMDLGTKEVTSSRSTLKEIMRVANGLGDRIMVECNGLCPRKCEV